MKALAESIPGIISFFEALGCTRVRVMLGWACSLPIDELYQWQEISLGAVETFIEENRRSGVFELGGSDLFIEDNEETFRFQLCHESDIHFITAETELAKRVLDEWKGKGFAVSMSAPKRAGPGLEADPGPRKWWKVN